MMLLQASVRKCLTFTSTTNKRRKCNIVLQICLPILGASAKQLRLQLVSSHLSVRLPAENGTTPIGRILGKFQIWYLCQNLSTHIHLGSNRTKITFYIKTCLHLFGHSNGECSLTGTSRCTKTGRLNNLEVNETVLSVRDELRPKNSELNITMVHDQM